MRCVVPSCDNEPNTPPGKQVTFFKFPMEPSLHAAWLEALRKACLQPKDCGIVCANHFSSKDLLDEGSGTLKLRAGAVPIVDIQLSLESLQPSNKLRNSLCLDTIDSYSDRCDLNIELMEKDEKLLSDKRDDAKHLSGLCEDNTGDANKMEVDGEIQQDIIRKAQENTGNIGTVRSHKNLTNNRGNFEVNQEVEKGLVVNESDNNFRTLSDPHHEYTIDRINNEDDEIVVQDVITEGSASNYVTSSGSPQEKDNELVKSKKDKKIEQDIVVEGVIRSGTVSSSRCCSHQEKRKRINAGHVSFVTKKKVVQDIAVEEGACNSASVGTSSIYQGIAIDRVKTENEEETEQAVVLYGSANVDGSVVTSTSCQDVIVARIKFENDEFDQDIFLNVDTSINDIAVTPNSYHAVVDSSIKSSKRVLDIGAAIDDTDTTPSYHELTAVKPVTESHEQCDQSIGIGESTSDVDCVNVTVITSKTGKNVEVDKNTVAGAGVQSSVNMSYSHKKTAPYYFMTEDDEEYPLYLGIGEGTSEVDGVLISSSHSDHAIDRETEIDEEIKQCIALEEEAGNDDTDMTRLHGKTAQDSFVNGIYEDNDAVNIGENSTSNVGIVSRSSNNADITLENESCNETEYKFLLVPGDAISKVDSNRVSEKTNEANAVPEQFNHTEIDIDQKFIDDFGLTGEKFSCEICHYETGNDIHMLAHLKAHAAIKHYNCETCNYKTTSNNSLQIHLLTHSGKKAYKCKVCKRLFGRKSHLKRHKLQHSDEKPYMCDVCKSVFGHKSSLRTHMLIHFNINAYSCRMCEKKFARKVHFKEHLKVHSGDRPNLCPICNKSFRRNDDLQNHMLSHSGKRPYKCENCNKSYSHKRNLLVHVKVHSAVRPYSCEVCDKSFLYKHSLQSHSRTHSGEKPYFCDKCDKAFRRRDALRVHKATHAHKNFEYKEYTCKICKEVFSVKRLLRQHMLVHSGKKLYKCDLCPKEFCRSSSLQNHMLLHSNSSADPVKESQAHRAPQTI